MTIFCPLTPSEITDVINMAPSSYGQATALNLFKFKGITGTTFGIEERNAAACNGVIPTAPYCCDYDNAANTTTGRKFRFIDVPHTPFTDSIRACDLAGQPGYASTPSLVTVGEEVGVRMNEMRQKLDFTMEYRYLSALKGVLRDADGTVLLDLFKHFGVDQKVFQFDFGDPSFDVNQKLRDLGRYMTRVARQVAWRKTVFFVDSIFFDALVTHAQMQDLYKRCCDKGEKLITDASVSKVGDMASFTIGNFTFVEYYNQGCEMADPTDPDQVRNAMSFLEAGSGIGFPISISGQSIYEVVGAPRMTLKDVNKKAKALFHAFQKVNDDGDAIHLKLETNSLPIVKQPALLVKLVANL